MFSRASILLRITAEHPRAVYLPRPLCTAAAKKKAKKSKKAKKGEGNDEDKEDDWIAHLIDTAESVRKTKFPFSEEEEAEHKRIGAEYTRQRMIQDNQFKKDLSTKIWLQQEALRALPPSLRQAAEEVDDTPPPEDRPFPIFMTPPVPGLNLRDESADDEEEDPAIGSQNKDSEY